MRQRKANEQEKEMKSSSLPYAQIGDMPFEQTPFQALFRCHGITSWVITIFINWGVNTGLSFASLHSYDYISVWENQTIDGVKFAATPVALELFITCLALPFLMTLLSAPGARGAIKKGETVPVSAASIQGSWWRFTPARATNWLSRCLYQIVFCLVTYFPVTLFFVFVACQDHSLAGSGATCAWNITNYCYFKGLWAGGMALLFFPFAFVSALNRAGLPDDVLEAAQARAPALAGYQE